MVDLRNLPSVDGLIAELADAGASSSLPRALLVDVARASIESARASLIAGDPADAARLARAELRTLRRLRHQPIVNATGVLLHTNLGRAPLHPEAAAAAADAAQGYGNIEFDLETGSRGSRGGYANRLLAELTGAQAAMVVNNNAGALFLVLHALGAAGEVPVSRGELIEIGGSYRLPELMGASGARLVEVGTTNRTRTDDYERAITEHTTLLLKVHPSNYRVMGFAEETPGADLVRLARANDLPSVFDVGSGLLDSNVPWLEGAPPPWLAGEPAVSDEIIAGFDAVTFSGDKLFGGPQAGIIVGSHDVIAALARSPVARALRVDGATLAALTATADLYADGRGAEIPFWSMADHPYELLEQRLSSIADDAGIPGEIRRSDSMAGAGSVPGMAIPSPVLVVAGRGEEVWPRLLEADPIVVARRDAGDLLIDARAIDPEDDHRVAAALGAACRS